MVAGLVALWVFFGATVAGLLAWAFAVYWLPDLLATGPYYTPSMRRAIKEDREFTRVMRERRRRDGVPW